MFWKKVLFLSFGILLFLFSAQAEEQEKEGKADDLSQKKIERQPALEVLKNLFVDLASKVNPAVVNIFTESKVPAFPMLGYNDPFLEQFFGPMFQSPSTPSPVRSLGSGFIIRKDGLIVTNTHVVDQADTIKVKIMDAPEDQYPVKLVGKDKFTDIALLKMNIKKDLSTVKLGNSSELKVGEWVVAFGNPFGHGNTVTQGIISAMNRNISDLKLFNLLQTDASINPGNSGGPLVNTKAEVIGVNTAMRSHGIGFAVPIDNVKLVLSDLEKYGSVRRGYLGVLMLDYLPSKPGYKHRGVLIRQVEQKSPASEVGLKPGDIVVKFNGNKTKTALDLMRFVSTAPINKKVPIEFYRDDKTLLSREVVLRQRSSQHLRFEQQASSGKKDGKAQKRASRTGLTLSLATEQYLNSLNIPVLKQVRPIVTHVEPGSPADRGGLKKHDILLKVNGNEVYSPGDVIRYLGHRKSNQIRWLRYRKESRQFIDMGLTITF